MPGFTSRDDIILEATTNGKVDSWSFMKIAPRAAEAAGVWQLLAAGLGNPGAMANPAATPGTIYNSDSTTPVAGSIYFPDRSTDLKFLASLGAVATVNCTLMLFDFLTGVSGLVINTTGVKTVNSGALPRYATTAAGNNEPWLHITTASTAAGSMNLNSYTDAAGTAGLAGPAIALPAAATDIDTFVPLPVNAANRGVRSVESLNVGTAATTAVASLFLIRSIAKIPLVANQWNEVSFIDDLLGARQIFDNATLGLAILASATTALTVYGEVQAIYG